MRGMKTVHARATTTTTTTTTMSSARAQHRGGRAIGGATAHPRASDRAVAMMRGASFARARAVVEDGESAMGAASTSSSAASSSSSSSWMTSTTRTKGRDARDYWFPVAFARDVRDKTSMATFDLFNVPWVLFRGEDGELGCVKDECAHRACPLSLGKVVEGRIQCPYHGWEYTTGGACVKMPSCKFLKDVVVNDLRVIERDGMVFVWPGASDPRDFIGMGDDGAAAASGGAEASWDEDVYEANGPGMFTPREGFVTMAEVTADVDLDSQVVVERLLDITERARREPVGILNRGAGRFQAIDATKAISKILRVGYDPVPQSVVFKPSCVISSTIALKPRIGGDTPMGCVEQLHVCLPTTPGSTRVLFRMAFDFVPSGAENAAGDVWKNLAIQVLQEQLEDVRDVSLKSETTSTAAESFRNFRGR